MSVRSLWTFEIAGVIVGLVVGGLGLVVAVTYAAGGHGTYLPATILFPYTMFLAKAFVGSITAPLVMLAAAEFPAYGFVIGAAARRQRWRLVLPTLLLVHAGVVIFGILSNSNWRSR